TYRPSPPGGQGLRPRLQDQGRPAGTRRPQDLGGSGKTGPACLYPACEASDFGETAGVSIGTPGRFGTFTYRITARLIVAAAFRNPLPNKGFGCGNVDEM